MGRWDVHGQPVNIQAAAADAIRWLYLLRHSAPEDIPKLTRCMKALSDFAKDCDSEQS